MDERLKQDLVEKIRGFVFEESNKVRRTIREEVTKILLKHGVLAPEVVVSQVGSGVYVDVTIAGKRFEFKVADVPLFIPESEFGNELQVDVDLKAKNEQLQRELENCRKILLNIQEQFER